MSNIKEGQVWKQGQGTPRQGEDALWVVKGFPVVNTRYANMECIGTGETKQITVKTIKTHYSLAEEGLEAEKETEMWGRVCYEDGCGETISIEVPSNGDSVLKEAFENSKLAEAGWTRVNGASTHYHCPSCTDKEGYSNMVDTEGHELPRSNIYPKLFTGEYIVNPNFLVVYGDKCYGCDEWESDIVIDGLASRVRGNVSKGNWFEDHLGDTIKVFNVDKKEMIASLPLIACFPAMSPPTVDEAMEMARNRKRVVDRLGDEGTIIGVHGKSEDRDILFLVRFDGDYPECPEVGSEIEPMWYHGLVERWV